MERPVRVLGVDPGLTRCGIGVVEGPAGRPAMVAATCARTATDAPIEQRLETIHTTVSRLVAEHRPDVLACERVLFSANARTAMGVGQAAGVALLAAAEAGVPVRSYTPTEVKLAIAGHGAASKEAVARMVAAQLRLAAPPDPADVADALAVALCHLSRSPLAEAAADGSRSDWSSVLDRPHIRVAGGTGDPT